MNPASDVSAKPWWVYALQIAVVVAVAEASYRWIETPFRHGALFLRCVWWCCLL